MTDQQFEFIWHTHALRALGPELITNNLVAIIELIKNSYDAFATKVDVIFECEIEPSRFANDEFGKISKIVISDNGIGMNTDEVRDYWFVIGTPNKEENRLLSKNNQKRYVTGSKGIGRLSVARLGGLLKMTTKKNTEENAISFLINWDQIFENDEMPLVDISYIQGSGIDNSGTIIEISKIRNSWVKEDLEELSEGLSRFNPPFKVRNDFKINLKVINTKGGSITFPINYQEFLDFPIYRIKGTVEESGEINCTYHYSPLGSKEIQKEKDLSSKWIDVIKNIKNRRLIKSIKHSKPTCGSFNFEIRCWDIDPSSTEEISNLFNIKRQNVKDSIKYFMGISVYRDGILVMPKEERTRDWLGLDLRRVSHVGDRISTNQIVGCVYISSETNTLLKDASNREGFVENLAVSEFKVILSFIVSKLENERNFDRAKREPSITNLFKSINANDLLVEAEDLYKNKEVSKQFLEHIVKFNINLKQTRKRIETHFRYYGQLATLGQISGVVLHEIRSGLISIGILLDKLDDYKNDLDISINKFIDLGRKSVERLEHLADKFTPLASRRIRKQNTANLSEAFLSAMELLEKELSDNNVKVLLPKDLNYVVKINPTDIITVIINIILNSIYWLSKCNKENNRNIQISSFLEGSKIMISFFDNGPGVDEKDAEIIFQPGVTRKPYGIGMGLPISVFLLENYDSKIYLETTKNQKGANFIIDLQREVN